MNAYMNLNCNKVLLNNSWKILNTVPTIFTEKKLFDLGQ